MKKPILPLLIFLLVVMGFGVFNFLNDKQVENNDDSKKHTLNDDNYEEECDPLLSEKICNYISASSYWVDDINVVDVTGDGVTHYLVEVVNEGCGSCHPRYVLFFENDKVYYQYDGDDASVYEPDKIKDGKVVIEEPIRKEDEALCCASSYKKTLIQCEKENDYTLCEKIDN